jgi:hypothetical protein
MGGDEDRIGVAEAASTLGWWLEAGVDVAVAESPRNWLERKPEPPNVRPPSAESMSGPIGVAQPACSAMGRSPKTHAYQAAAPGRSGT